MSKFFIDTEFIENGKTIDLISIALVHEGGASYYAVSSEYDASKASDWVRENVLPNLGRMPPKSRSEIKAQIVEFVKGVLGGSKPEFWGYYADYDWVAFCQLFGTMMDLPKGFPMYCRDLKQWCDALGNPKLPEQGPVDGPEHNALADARWNLRAYNFLTAPIKIDESVARRFFSFFTTDADERDADSKSDHLLSVDRILNALQGMFTEVKDVAPDA